MVKLMKNRINFTEVTGVTDNSSKVEQGFVFVAIKGAMHDGHKYISQAIDKGSKTIIHQDEVIKDQNINYVKVKDSKEALKEITNIIYPNQPKYIMGITGTSGKSSIVHFIREILALLNKKSVSIGTMGVLGDYEMDLNLTTPSAVQLHEILDKVSKDKIDYAAIECSSHGIDQHRLDSVEFLSCGFTNLSQDHLDYHKNMDEYFRAKQKLFSWPKLQYSVLNTDIKEFDKLYEYCKEHKQKIICYGKKKIDNSESNIIIENIENTSSKQIVNWDIDGKKYQTNINLIGEFQIYNLACSIGLLKSCNIEIDKIMPLLSKLKNATGRMELVANYNDAKIFVDYSHKPEALSHALQTLKQATRNNLWLVFGCGGDRDKEKRPIMGKIATDYAQRIVITDDNPRNEDAANIRQEIISGCLGQVNEIGDRKNAIEFALDNLQPGDSLIIAGKGHETYQIIGKEIIEFSDKLKVLDWISQKSQ